jgi:2'-5' RNA ligase
MAMPYPHLTYQVAQGYDRASVEAAMQRLAHETPPFSIRATGLESVDGKWPIILVGVAKGDALGALHRRIWECCAPLGRDVFPYYAPGQWVPHITLAHGGDDDSLPLDQELVGRIVGRLEDDDFRWNIGIDNLALVWDYGVGREPARSFPLQGK